jgi:competence protein ComGC
LVLGILSLVLAIICIGPLLAIPAVIFGHIALSKINRSGGMLGGRGLAIGGLVTGYISLALIPVLVAMAIPNVIKARDTAQKNACINNLRVIDTAKQQWALDNSKSADDVPTAQDLDKYIPGGYAHLHCKRDGEYVIGKVSEAPTCSIPGHELGDAQTDRRRQ